METSKTTLKEKVIIALRWIALLPASALGSLLVYVVFVFLNKTIPFTGNDTIWNYAIEFIGHAMMGAAFVLIGICIAPSRRKSCAIVLFAIACVVSGASLAFGIMSDYPWKDYVGMLCTILGAGHAYFNSDKIIAE